jgi:hypothetical protein
MASLRLTRIVAEIVAIPGPVVTPKGAGMRVQSLPRCKKLLAVIAYQFR